MMDAKLSKLYALFFLILVSFDAAVKLKSMMLLENNLKGLKVMVFHNE